jgi:hypothetical protein
VIGSAAAAEAAQNYDRPLRAAWKSLGAPYVCCLGVTLMAAELSLNLLAFGEGGVRLGCPACALVRNPD